VLLAIQIIAFVAFSIFPSKMALTSLLIVSPLTSVYATVTILYRALAVSLIIDELSAVHSAVWLAQNTNAVLKPLSVVSLI
jgi:hypothetical protein